MAEAEMAIEACQRLIIPQGRLAGSRLVLAPYQRRFIEGLLADGTTVGCWSIGRGNGKSATAAALAATHLLGWWDPQPQREVALVGRTKDQAAIAFNFARSFIESLDVEDRHFEKLTIRSHPAYELVLHADDGPHLLRALSSDGKSALGGGATFAVLDERAAWRPGRGEEIEAAILTSIGKRDGRVAVISTSAPDDANAFSQWLDRPPPGCYVQEHRPAPNLPADDMESLLVANPGAAEGIGARPEWLRSQAAQAVDRGGQALASFRNLHRNERVAAEGRDVLIHVDEWLACEHEVPPPREGRCIVGLDFGGSASMTATAWYWPATGRLEVRGWFPSRPDLLARGHNDHVGDRYTEMARRGELATLGDLVVPASEWIAATAEHAGDVAVVVADRFKQAEVGEALAAAGLSAEVVWRGMGWRDGGEDCRRFQNAVRDRRVAVECSLLMRASLADAVVALDPSGNPKLTRARSTGRIDPVAAAVLAVAEGARRSARPAARAPRVAWV